ncbi:MAG: SH3 domain-containing protein [Eubacterium sp.]|nr:SH3 domain-containing protein [Eubacterium sp.]
MKKQAAKLAAVAAAVMLAAPAGQVSVQKGCILAQAKETAARQRAKYYVVTADTLNVRCGAGTGYTVIGTLTKGLRVKVSAISGEKGNRWAKIRFAGLTAYVSAKHLSKA